uniref:Uncharacterized protein n=1 Tax=Anopheles melas TaxID=34690 RepID=A0A182UA75_9DIPT
MVLKPLLTHNPHGRRLHFSVGALSKPGTHQPTGRCLRLYELELGKTHKKAELGPDDSNKFRTQFRRTIRTTPHDSRRFQTIPDDSGRSRAISTIPDDSGGTSDSFSLESESESYLPEPERNRGLFTNGPE